MSGWWIADLYHDGRIIELISWIFWVILSITLHELAHGWVAVWQGDDTPRVTGHLSASPFVHMGHVSLIVFLIAGIAWGQMPVDPRNFRWRRWGDAVVAFAGPAMNLALAFLALTGAAIWIAYIPAEDPLDEKVVIFLTTGGWLNVILCGFNLLPVPPLDGSRILAGMWPQFRRWMQNPNAGFAGLLLVMLVFVTDIFDIFWLWAMEAAHQYVVLLLTLLP